MPTRDVTEFADIAGERERAAIESSNERFDRIAFAERALALLRPRATRIALCEGRTRVRIEAGRAWGKRKDERWAIVSVPPDATRRAIAVAVAELSGHPPPYAFDVLLGALADDAS